MNRPAHVPRWRSLLAVIVAVIAAGVVVLPAKPAKAAFTCSSLMVIGVRGSGESYNGNGGMGPTNYTAYQQIKARVPGAQSYGLPYDAVALIPEPANALVNEYWQSISVGAIMLGNVVEQLVETCPYQRIALLGYSQGAHVVGQQFANWGVNPSIRDRIASVILFGDPKFNPSMPFNHGSYSGSLQGAFSGRTVSSTWWGITRSYCAHQDFACNWSVPNFAACPPWTTAQCGHFSYMSSGMAASSGVWAGDLFNSMPPLAPPPGTPAQTGPLTLPPAPTAPPPPPPARVMQQGQWFEKRQNVPNTTTQFVLGGQYDRPILGDWDGNGTKAPAVFRPSNTVWYFSNNPNGAPVAFTATWATANDIPVAGDWDGNGTDTIGVFRPSTGQWFLSASNTSPSAYIVVQHGGTGDQPVVGDWDNNGTDTIGVFRQSNGRWYLSNSNTAPAAHINVQHGGNGDQGVVGDWDSNGTDGIGVYRASNFTWYLSNSAAAPGTHISYVYGTAGDVPVAGKWGASPSFMPGTFKNGVWKGLITAGSAGYDANFQHGGTGDRPIVGDWNGDNVDTVGVFRPSNTGWYLSNATAGASLDIFATWATAEDLPVAGDWDGNGTDTVGVFRPSTGEWYLSNSNTSPSGVHHFVHGQPGDIPVVGDWNGDGTDTPGVFRPSNGYWYLSDTLNPVLSIYVQHGQPGDLPVVGDWDGNGTDGIGIFRPNGTWWSLANSASAPAADVTFTYATSTDLPIAGRWTLGGNNTVGVAR